jgi:hypothetical protein
MTTYPPFLGGIEHRIHLAEIDRSATTTTGVPTWQRLKAASRYFVSFVDNRRGSN